MAWYEALALVLILLVTAPLWILMIFWPFAIIEALWQARKGDIHPTRPRNNPPNS